MTGERTGPDAIRRIPPVLRFVLAWAVGWRYADDLSWAGFYCLVAVVLVGLAVRTLVRVRRLTPGQHG